MHTKNKYFNKSLKKAKKPSWKEEKLSDALRNRRVSGSNRGMWQDNPDEFNYYPRYLIENKENIAYNEYMDEMRRSKPDAEIDLSYRKTDEPTYALWRLTHEIMPQKQSGTYYQNMTRNIPEGDKKLVRWLSRNMNILPSRDSAIKKPKKIQFDGDI